MKRILLGLALLLAPCVALGNHVYTQTGTLNNGSTTTTGGLGVEGRQVLSFGATFTAALASTYEIFLDVSFDGGTTWKLVTSSGGQTAAASSANYYSMTYTAPGKPGGGVGYGVPGPRVRVRLLNSTGGQITAGYVFAIAN